MKQNSSLSMVVEIMTEFVDLTGMTEEDKAPRRYLWTDAFAVCNFLEIYCQTSDDKYKGLALLLVDQVHKILGRHRMNDLRTGWISSLDEEEGERHPTKGGLRIGKKMSERGPSDRFDESLEWDRDGQYYHYLTKWMHALNCISRATGDRTYNTWAIEFAETVHDRFVYNPSLGGQKRMYWKMSIDLSRPLVPSMGNHDPLDGFITYNQLQLCVADDSEVTKGLELNEEITDMENICRGKSWTTDDPLGIGGLLCDACRVTQIIVSKNFDQLDLLENLLDASLQGLVSFSRSNSMNLPADYRLAFRELGLSIGMRAVEKLQGLIEAKPGMFPKDIHCTLTLNP